MLSATDHCGHNVTSYSDPFVVDKTAPHVGSVNVGHFMGHKYFVSDKDIEVHITDVRDIESGISSIQVGIGSNNEAADVINMRSYTGYIAHIENRGELLDGHVYFVIVTVREIVYYI